MSEQTGSLMVGKFAREAGVTEAWVRHMTRLQLLPDRRDCNNNRVFVHADVAAARALYNKRIKFTRHARA